MGHLKNTRQGWENERLAEFLLSRISFIANPAKISDDLGTDFICTLFREEAKKGGSQLFPTSSFAIQIKTGEPAELDVSKHLEYLRGLEIPFFLGFVHQEKLALHIYSCHHLPALFSGGGDRITSLTLIPANALNRDHVADDLRAVSSNPDKPAQLRVTYVTTLTATEDTAARASAAEKIGTQCSKSLTDIAAKISEEYFFALDDEVYWVAAGSGSFRTFRRNLAKRLLEAFANLNWALSQNGVDRDWVNREFSIYEKLFVELRNEGVGEIQIAEEAYKRVAQALGR